MKLILYIGLVVVSGNGNSDSVLVITRDMFNLTDSPLTITYRAMLTEANNASTVVNGNVSVEYFSSPHGMQVSSLFYFFLFVILVLTLALV